MSKTWLILDAPFLCHRLKHSMGNLSYKDIPTGIIYGFLCYIPILQEKFDTPHIIFCWDSKTSKREEIYPKYKQTRADRYKDMTDDELLFEDEFRSQMMLLRKRYLPTIGFKNVFVQRGYEGDDIIASICRYNLGKEDKAIIITSDHDLYQLITPQVTIYNPNTTKMMTLQGFKKKYGIHPKRWSSVKMYAGCSGDNVKGIKGVGEKTAIKYIKDELKKTFKVWERLTSEKGIQIAHRNCLLVQLPFVGVKIFKLKKDKITKEGWEKVITALGFKSIKNKIPRTAKSIRKKIR